MLVILGVLLFLALCWLVDFALNSHALDEKEVHNLANSRRRKVALNEYRFTSCPILADSSEKKAMRGDGEFLRASIPFDQGPAAVAGLLKSKRHEWIVVAFIESKTIVSLFWNKGRDGRSVSSALSMSEIVVHATTLQAQAVAVLHNHPNPDPRRYRVCGPSLVDLQSADYLKSLLEPKGIGLLEFVCERGVPHLFFASFPESMFPVEVLEDQVRQQARESALERYILRREIRAASRTPKIAG